MLRSQLFNHTIIGISRCRFDLVFVLVDNADGDQDQRLADHIFQSHTHADEKGKGSAGEAGRNKRQKNNDGASSTSSFSNNVQVWADTQDTDFGGSRGTLNPTESTRGAEILQEETDKTTIVRRIQNVVETQKNPIPQDMLKAYIQYARDYCDPKISKKAAKVCATETRS